MEQLVSDIQWTVPQHAWNVILQEKRQGFLPMFARILGLSLFAIWAIHRATASVLPSDFPWTRVIALTAAFATILSLMTAADKCLKRRTRTSQYQVGSRGLLIPSNKRPLVRWDRIASFEIQIFPQAPEVHALILHLKSGESGPVPLPGGETEAAIISRFTSHVPQGSPPQASAPLGSFDLILGMTVAAVTIWAAGKFLAQYLAAHPHHSGDFVNLILLIGLLAGPGTWLAILQRGQRANAQLVAYAGAINLVATFGSLFCAIMIEFSRPGH